MVQSQLMAHRVWNCVLISVCGYVMKLGFNTSDELLLHLGHFSQIELGRKLPSVGSCTLD